MADEEEEEEGEMKEEQGGGVPKGGGHSKIKHPYLVSDDYGGNNKGKDD